jgi:hypothetical protein
MCCKNSIIISEKDIIGFPGRNPKAHFNSVHSCKSNIIIITIVTAVATTTTTTTTTTNNNNNNNNNNTTTSFICRQIIIQAQIRHALNLFVTQTKLPSSPYLQL